MSAKKKGRPPGPKKPPALHPNTLCALAGQWTIGVGAPTPSGSQLNKGLAATSTTIDPRLVELILTIESTRGDPRLRDLHRESLAKLSHVSGIAAAIGDPVFFQQVATCMTIAAKTGGHPLRLDVLKAWIEARKLNNRPKLSDIRAGVKYRLGRIDPDSPPGTLMVIEGQIEDKTITDHLEAMGLKWESRVSGKK
jgi:hypothetical protein